MSISNVKRVEDLNIADTDGVKNLDTNIANIDWVNKAKNLDMNIVDVDIEEVNRAKNLDISITDTYRVEDPEIDTIETKKYLYRSLTDR